MVRTLVVSVRVVVLLALLCAVGAVAGGLGWPPAQCGAPRPGSSAGTVLVAWTLDSLRVCLRLAAKLALAHPQIAAVAAAVLGVWLLAGAARTGLAAPKDPRRSYTADERRAGFGRAGRRCEMDAWAGLARCRRPAEHGDHWWPHSRGGATSMPNLVASCAWHNTSKGATLPTSAQTRRIARRRRGYFPAGEPDVPGERYRARR